MSLLLFPDPTTIISDQGECIFYKSFFEQGKADSYLSCLIKKVPWIQEPIKIFGKEVMQPRLTAWFGDPGVSYSYSGITMDPIPWNDVLLKIKQKVEAVTGESFNSALLNYYRHGQDSMGWHRDNEPELRKDPTIASVSLGATRRFHLRKYRDKTRKKSIDLTHGSLLIMSGELQHYWEHQVPKTRKEVDGRVNITFRYIIDSP